jgi:hypothetical protein
MIGSAYNGVQPMSFHLLQCPSIMCIQVKNTKQHIFSDINSK